MKTVIFLDFDDSFPNRISFLQGSIAESKKQRQSLQLNPDIFFWKMDDVAIAMLNQLNKKFELIFVVSSSLARSHSKDVILNWLQYNGFAGHIHDDWTSSTHNHQSRLQEIEYWLSQHPDFKNHYIIIDDEVSAPEMKNNMVVQSSSINPSNIILISPENGILMSHYEKIYHILNKTN